MTGLEILASLFPVVVDAGKALVNKYITPDQFKPANIAEYVQARGVDLQWFQAINGAAGAEPSYPWVSAFKQMMRPFVGSVVLCTWAGLHIYEKTHPGAALNLDSVDSFASVIGFYLFGERTLFYARRSGKS